MVGIDVDFGTLLLLSNLLVLHAHLLLLGSSSSFSRDNQTPHLDEDYTYLGNLPRPTVEEELITLAQYNRCASVALAHGGASH